MERWLSWGALVLLSCTQGPLPEDAGTDAGKKDGAPEAAVGDAATQDVAVGDSGLGAGEICDPQNNECATGLLCCQEPTHLQDASVAYFCEKPVNKSCPLLP